VFAVATDYADRDYAYDYTRNEWHSGVLIPITRSLRISDFDFEEIMACYNFAAELAVHTLDHFLLSSFP
jgi:hypothetical protein